MVFSSFVFLFCFLPIILMIYYICPSKARNLILLVASLIFYAWGEPRYVLIMLFSTVFDYTNGRLIGYFKERAYVRRAKAVLVVDIIGNLAILGFFKYTDFVIESINSLTGAGLSLMHIALPIGISFYTFQTMSYTIDVYRGIVPPQRNILNFATYVTLFPQLIAGPIVQYKTIGEELSHRSVSWKDFSEGAFLFCVGMAKKVLLANQIGSLWDAISTAVNLSAASAWLGAVAFTFQIYFDFSGYSDMAIGLGRIFGFHFLKNFDHPYVSKSITEFWRRWHISLGTWFREYVYIPLGGNRCGIVRQIRNIMIVWFLTGLWHGASWNFVLWGLYYGVLLMIEKMVIAFGKQRAKQKAAVCGQQTGWLRLLKSVLSHIYAMVLVVIGWVIFAQTDAGALWDYLKAMFGVGVAGVDSDFFYYICSNRTLLVVLVVCSLDWSPLWGRLGQAIEKQKGAVEAILRILVMAVLFLLSVAFLVGDSYNPFLYFRF